MSSNDPVRGRATAAASWVAAAAVLLGGLWGAQPARAAACSPTQSSAGTDVVLTFSSVGTCDWTVPGWVTSVRVLVVGGGGGGGVNGRGGGGAGGMQEQSAYAVSAGSAVSVTVGGGGDGAYYGPNYTGWWHPQDANTVPAGNGGSSSFGSLVSLGGGRGSTCGASTPAGNGGSGGGSTGGCGAGTGTVGQGNNGSTSGSGGGAGTAGNANGSGGAGSSSDITGLSVIYAGGGGTGSCCGDSSTNSGGPGGGGNGARYNGTARAAAGQDGKGGGGGGGGLFPDGSRAADFSNDTSIGGKGGSGVVIVRYEGRTAQTITVASDKNPIIEEQTATLSASGHSGTGAITYAVASGSDVCSVNGATLTTIKPGTCTVTASIAHDATYAPATSAPLTITVTARLAQSLTIAADPNPVFARKIATLRPVGQSGTGTMTYSVQSGSEFCSISEDKLTGLTPGSCTVVGTISRDATYAAATSPPYTVDVRPGTPERPLMVDANPGDRQVTVIWDAPIYDGGSAVREYHVYAWPSGKRQCTVAATATSRYSCVVGGLRNGTTYEFWVQASSAVGLSPISERVKAKPAGKPGSPRNLAAKAADGVLRLAWDMPEDDGGSVLIQYLVERRVPGGTWEAVGYVDASKQTSAVMSSLVNSRDYEFRVSVNNASGYSPPSDPVTASVTVPRSVEPKLPAQVPPQSFIALGRLEKGSTYVKVASRTQRTCQVAEQYSNAIAFLQAGKCKLILFRDTASVDGAMVDEYELEVVQGSERASGVEPMDIWRFTFRPDGTGLDKASDARMRDFSAEWGWAKNLPRPSYGSAYTFCPPSTINATGAFADRRDLASRRCNAMSWLAGVAVRNTVDNDGRIAAKPKLGSANDDEIFEVGMLPKFWPPSAPRNLKVDADAYDATITWDPPGYDGGADKIGYAVYVRPEGEDKWIQVSSEGLRARVAATMWDEIPVERDIDVMVKASSFGGGQGGVAQTTFRLGYRKPQTANIPAQVPVGSWMEVFEDRGRPATVATVPSEYSSACSVYQYRYLAFVGQGKCLAITYQLNGKGGSTPRRGEVVEVTAGGARGAGLMSMALEEITFSGKSSQPDARGMKVIDGLKDKDVIGYHLYSPIPGPMPAGLAKERFDKVWQLLQVKSSTAMTWSTLKSSGLPEGDGNTIYVAVLRGGSAN